MWPVIFPVGVKMAKNCIKITISIFFEQNSGGCEGVGTNQFLVGGGDSPSPSVMGNPDMLIIQFNNKKIRYKIIKQQASYMWYCYHEAEAVDFLLKIKFCL